MEHVINIHHNGQEIHLEKGKFKIDILGGWGVKLRQFSISFRNSRSGLVINCKRSFWPIQSLAFRKKAKRVFSVDVPENGTYTVEFMNAITLEVKETNLLIGGLFQEPVPNENISIYIH